MLLGLGTVLAVARLAARVIDVRAGLAAAFLVAVSPVFLRWTIEPLSGTAAMFCCAMAALAASERGGFKRGVAVGAWLGAGVLMAFQVLLVAGGFGLFLLLRDRWKGRAHTLGLGAGLALLLLVQASLDHWVYGAFGSSLWQYLVENGAGTLATKLYELGQRTGIDAITRLGLTIYNAAFEGINQANQDARIAPRHMMPRDWYVTHLHTHLWAWPLLGLLGLGLVRSLLRPRWMTTLLAGTVLLNVWIMSSKGSQSFRLWLPLLPGLAVVGGAGWSWLRGPAEAGFGRRLTGAVLLLAAGGVLSASGIVRQAPTWASTAATGMRSTFVNDAVAAEREDAADPAPPPRKVAAGYHWAIRYRVRLEALEDVKLPAIRSTPGAALDRGLQRVAETLAELGTQVDWFVTHLQLIEQDAAIARTLN